MQGVTLAHAQAGRHQTIGDAENMGKQLRKAINMAQQLKPETEWTNLVTPCAHALHVVPRPTRWSPYEPYMAGRPALPELPKIFREDARDVTTFLRERDECHQAAQAAVQKLRELAAKAYNKRSSEACKYGKGDYV